MPGTSSRYKPGSTIQLHTTEAIFHWLIIELSQTDKIEARRMICRISCSSCLASLPHVKIQTTSTVSSCESFTRQDVNVHQRSKCQPCMHISTIHDCMTKFDINRYTFLLPVEVQFFNYGNEYLRLASLYSVYDTRNFGARGEVLQ